MLKALSLLTMVRIKELGARTMLHTILLTTLLITPLNVRRPEGPPEILMIIRKIRLLPLLIEEVVVEAVVEEVAGMGEVDAVALRDLRVLVDAHWELRELRAFDIFPMTEHVEIVAVLEPAGS